MSTKPKISVCLWFDSNAEEAARFYASVFKDASIEKITRYGREGYEIHGRKEGSVMTVTLKLNGLELTLLNGGPVFMPSEAASIVVHCDTQEEIDYYWEKLGAGGDPKARQCGWLKDQFGVSWQVTPSLMSTLYPEKPDDRAERAMKAMLGMKKPDIRALEKAYQGS